MKNKTVKDKIEHIDEWLFDKIDKEGKSPFPFNILIFLWFTISDSIRECHYRIFVRGVCAIKGCDLSYSCGGYLPDDVCEWGCKRCCVEGINQIEYTEYKVFYPDTKLRNLKDALLGH